jgi:hypothetical protein
MATLIHEGIIDAIDINQQHPLPVDRHPLHLARLEFRNLPDGDELSHTATFPLVYLPHRSGEGLGWRGPSLSKGEGRSWAWQTPNSA